MGGVNIGCWPAAPSHIVQHPQPLSVSPNTESTVHCLKQKHMPARQVAAIATHNKPQPQSTHTTHTHAPHNGNTAVPSQVPAALGIPEASDQTSCPGAAHKCSYVCHDRKCTKRLHWSPAQPRPACPVAPAKSDWCHGCCKSTGGHVDVDACAETLTCHFAVQ
jgi:hypothetical protein